MRDQSGGYPLRNATWAGRELGTATALVDEDLLRVLLLDGHQGEKSVQLRYDAIVEVGVADGAVSITCRDGRMLVVAPDDAGNFRSTVLAACRALPEVTRALRALGSRRGGGGSRRNPGEKEGRFFAPFIGARRASMEARDAASVIAAFDARKLSAQVSKTIREFAAEMSAGHPARQRALEAELGDGAERLVESLETLKELANRALTDVDDLSQWRDWAEGVQDVFEWADRSWVVIEPIVGRR